MSPDSVHNWTSLFPNIYYVFPCHGFGIIGWHFPYVSYLAKDFIVHKNAQKQNIKQKSLFFILINCFFPFSGLQVAWKRFRQFDLTSCRQHNNRDKSQKMVNWLAYP